MQHSSIKLFFYLAVFGTIVSLVTLALPWLGIQTDLLSSAGEISSGIAAIFGLAVAAIALKSFVWSESTERQKIDAVCEALTSLKNDVLYYQSIVEILDNVKAETPERVAEIKRALEKEALEALYRCSINSITPDLVNYAEESKNDMRSILYRFRIGLILAKESGWMSNQQVTVNLQSLWNWLKDQDSQKVTKAYS